MIDAAKSKVDVGTVIDFPLGQSPLSKNSPKPGKPLQTARMTSTLSATTKLSRMER
jgi:hypothetical protein